MSLKILYPEGKKQALTFSYDDNQIFDRRLISILNENGLKGTFHLNSGTVGTRDAENEFVSWDEVKTLYAGHEVAIHGVNHPWMAQLSQGELMRELGDDRRNLEKYVSYPVRGMSYPFGEYSDTIIAAAKAMGIEYSRTVCNTNGYNWPSEFLTWHPTCHHNDVFTKKELVENFLNPASYMNLPLLYVWGHSFEFERQHTWDKMESFCKKVANHDSIWYAANIEIKEYVEAVRGLVTSMDGTMVYNPSAQTVFCEKDGKVCELAPGKQISL